MSTLKYETVKAAMERVAAEHGSPHKIPHTAVETEMAAEAAIAAIIEVESFVQSGREDSNLRPLGPEPSALARLSHAPIG